jgi:DHA3 family macrolide efflux protein-like MFS transporter
VLLINKGGIVADTIFEPLMTENGVLGRSLGTYLGTGPGRGVGLMFVVVGLFNAIIAILAFLYKPLRYIDTELPDKI